MKISQQWKNTIKLLLFLYVIFQFLSQFYTIYQAYSVIKSPLVPKDLSTYIAFPHFILIFYWAIAVDIFWKFFNDKQNLKYNFGTILLSFFVFVVSYPFLYQLLMYFNPFG